MVFEKNKDKICCFIGHRKINITEQLEKDVYNYAEMLIFTENVKTFLFGSKSDFDTLCHSVVSKLKEKYPDIKRVAYTCRSEAIFLESEISKWEQILSTNSGHPVELLGFEEEFEHKTKFVSGKASYVERNFSMIDNSDFCLFYYDENYLPAKRKFSKRDVFMYQPKSGTSLAYKYAKQKKKNIKNFFI